ncbi:MAG: PASTA domain-containing protein [Cytophagaceae bacterium]|jgi:beta-lactam-binding protein with PASTA domain|nr:PASTA domain-containing protein [Cytophagaceae bacterium]
MSFFTVDSWKGVLIHIAIITGIAVGLLLLFFYVYLPNVTNHGDYIEVPKLEGLSVEQVEQLMDEKGLRYEINDSTYKPDVKPNIVLSQHPLPGAQVKNNRRIYISITATFPPDIAMPDLIDRPMRDAENQIRFHGLTLGNVDTVPYPGNVVRKQYFKGKEIAKGTLLPKGSTIDLIIGSGGGGSEVELPSVVGKTKVEAESILNSFGLATNVIYDPSITNIEAGLVAKTQPAYEIGKKVRSGDIIDIIIAGEE